MELVKNEPGLVKARLINIFNQSYIKQKDILLNRNTGFLCLKDADESLVSNAYFEKLRFIENVLCTDFMQKV